MRVFSVGALWSLCFLWASTLAWAQGESGSRHLSEASKDCLECHKTETPLIYQEWGKSRHYSAHVGCYECHAALKGEKDAISHEGQWISVIVSPKDCSRCHASQVREFASSHHAKALAVNDSMKFLVADVVVGNKIVATSVEGARATNVNGCANCHGTLIKVGENGKLDAATWPNNGIGRINPDGSEGSCAACHSKHLFSVAEARRSESCGVCHTGEQYPHLEIYQASQHGHAYAQNAANLNLNSPKWIAGEDYVAAPTCATCHMSAAQGLSSTHNTGLRLRWKHSRHVSRLAPEEDQQAKLESGVVSAAARTATMKTVCSSCHIQQYGESFYTQYESLIGLYHTKYAEPGFALYQKLTELSKVASGKGYTPFAQSLDFVWFDLWHGEGRRLRYAAAHQATWIYDESLYNLARQWYNRYLPEVQRIITEGQQSAKTDTQKLAREAQTLLQQIMSQPSHVWYSGQEVAAPVKAEPKPAPKAGP